MKSWKIALLGAFVLLPFAGGVSGQAVPGAQYLIPFPAHKIIGNVYFVGTQSLGDFLIVTPEGNILINSGLQENVPLIEQSVEKLGFHFKDIKILLLSQAHDDHGAGNARVKELT